VDGSSIDPLRRRHPNQGIKHSELPFWPVFSDIVCPSARGCTLMHPRAFHTETKE